MLPTVMISQRFIPQYEAQRPCVFICEKDKNNKQVSRSFVLIFLLWSVKTVFLIITNTECIKRPLILKHTLVAKRLPYPKPLYHTAHIEFKEHRAVYIEKMNLSAKLYSLTQRHNIPVYFHHQRMFTCANCAL